MPTPPRPLPTVLRGAPFTVAQGRSLGLGQTRLRGSDLARPFRGVRIGGDPDSAGPHIAESGRTTAPGVGDANPSGGGLRIAPELGLADRCAALLVAMPSSAHLSHRTAAQLWPLPLPRAVADELVHISVRLPDRAPRRAGVAGHLVKDRRLGVVRRAGLPLVDPATMFCQLSTQLSLHDLVAVGDALVLQPVYPDTWDERPWVSLTQLRERVELFCGRGKRAASEAVALLRPGAESRPETLLRLAILDAGLPEPEVNVELWDSGGRFLGRADLVYGQWRVIVEYDGDQHRTSTRQFDRDVLRLEGFAAAGWTVVRVLGRSFFGERDTCIARIRHALVAAGWHA